MVYYSAVTGGFYLDHIHGTNIPSDAVTISDLEYKSLIESQDLGRRIISDNRGIPIAVDPKTIASVDDIINEINCTFDADERSLLDSIGRTILSDGATESDALAALRVAWANLQDAKQAAILAALGV